VKIAPVQNPVFYKLAGWSGFEPYIGMQYGFGTAHGLSGSSELQSDTVQKKSYRRLSEGEQF
jgi:hypothetical protein